MKNLLQVTLFIAVINLGFAQTNVVWEHTNSYIPDIMVKDHDNNIIAASASGYTGEGIAKYNLNGDVLWSISNYAFTGTEDLSSWNNRKLSIDSENNIYLTLLYSDASYNNYNKVIKISSAGVIVWQTMHLLNTTPNGAYLQNGIEVDSQKNVYVYGVDYDPNVYAYTRFLVIKYNADGVFQWKKALTNNTGGNSIASALVIDQQDNIIVGGGLDINGFTGVGSYVLYKFDYSGNQVWKIQEDNIEFRPYRIIVDNQNNLTLIGGGSVGGGTAARIIKYESGGSELFDINYSNGLSTQTMFGRLPDLTPDQNGNFYVTSGYSTANNTVSFKTTKFNSSGQELWQKTFSPNTNTNAINIPSDASVDDFGNISVVGVSHEWLYGSATNIKIPVIKYDPDGNQLWTANASGINDANYPPSILAIGKYTYVGTRQQSAYAPGILTKYSDSNVINFYSGCAYGAKGTEVLVPIATKNFKNVVSAQFSITWDPTVVSFAGVENFGLNGLGVNSFGLSQVNAGVLTFSWNDPSLQSQALADDSPLFNIRFSLTGDYNTSTPVTITGQPVAKEVIGLNSGNYEPMEITLDACSISIDPLIFQGQVLYSNSEPVQNVTVDMSGSDSQSMQTDDAGSYYFYVNSAPTNATYILTPSKTDDPDPLNGIDVQDVASIRRHILQTQPLAGPYQIIAADVNQSHTVTTLDIVLVQALILGIKSNFPNNAQWTFVPTDFQFTDTNNPFPYPTNKTLTVTSSSTNDFIAIKYGDVNDSRDNAQSGRVQVADVIFESAYPQEENDLVTVPVRVYGFNDVSAYQFTMKWDTESLDFIKKDNGSVAGEFGEHKVANGILTTVWDHSAGKSISLPDGSTLFTLKFRKKTEIANVQIELNSTVPARVFDGSLKKLNFVTQQGVETPSAFAVSCYPNPFAMSTPLNIKLRLPEAGQVGVEIITIDGRKIRTILTECNAGTNTFMWDGRDDAGAESKSGLYMVKITNGSLNRVMKVVKY